MRWLTELACSAWPRCRKSAAFKARDPELYARYLTKLDQTRFRLDRPTEYASYQDLKVTQFRRFELIEPEAEDERLEAR